METTTITLYSPLEYYSGFVSYLDELTIDEFASVFEKWVDNIHSEYYTYTQKNSGTTKNSVLKETNVTVPKQTKTKFINEIRLSSLTETTISNSSTEEILASFAHYVSNINDVQLRSHSFTGQR